MVEYSEEKVKELWYEYKELTGNNTLPGTETHPIKINEEGLDTLIKFLSNKLAVERTMYINGVDLEISKLRGQNN